MRNTDWSDRAAARDAVVTTMKRYLPTDELASLMDLSVEPVAAKMGLIEEATVR